MHQTMTQDTVSCPGVFSTTFQPVRRVVRQAQTSYPAVESGHWCAGSYVLKLLLENSRQAITQKEADYHRERRRSRRHDRPC
jgi:hypothetical protein